MRILSAWCANLLSLLLYVGIQELVRRIRVYGDYTHISSLRSCGEMDIITVFGTVVPGSSPGGSTKTKGRLGAGFSLCASRRRLRRGGVESASQIATLGSNLAATRDHKDS